MELFKEKRIIIGVIILFIVLNITNSIGLGYLFVNQKAVNHPEDNLMAVSEQQELKESVEDEFYVEVKGEVKKPGVFKVKEGTIINDVIKKAGGLTKNAYTKNINLSKKLSSELVVYIYSKSEFKTKKNNNVTTTKTCTTNTYEIDNCTENKTSIIENTNTKEEPSISIDNKTESNNVANASNGKSENTKININTADIKALSTLTGIGEKKALAIIEYRNTKGAFKTIDEIKNISGIGEATFAKFKDNITV